MVKLLLPLAGLTLMSVAALVVPRAQATVPLAPASIRATVGETSAVEQTAVKCAHRRVCRPGQGCAWRKVCKRW
jgi:hypothetical protein